MAKSKGIEGCLAGPLGCLAIVVTVFGAATVKAFGVGLIIILFLVAVGFLVWYFIDDNQKSREEEKELKEKQEYENNKICISEEEYGRLYNSGLMFHVWFEWIEESPTSYSLKYKSLWRNDRQYTYAPELEEYNSRSREVLGIRDYYDKDVYLVDDVVYDAVGHKIANLQPNGYLFLSFPVHTGKIHIHHPKTTMWSGDKGHCERINDNQLFLSLDFSEQVLQEMSQGIILTLKNKEELRRQAKIEKEKRRLLAREKDAQIKKQALNELVDEGIIFPESGKRPPIPKDVVDAVWTRDGGHCVYCGSTKNLQLDHIIPFSKGGATTVENLQLLCQECNLKKSNNIGI